MIIIIINPICIIHNDSFAVCINPISMYSSVEEAKILASGRRERQTEKKMARL